jgi:hypothetical protein
MILFPSIKNFSNEVLTERSLYHDLISEATLYFMRETRLKDGIAGRKKNCRYILSRSGLWHESMRASELPPFALVGCESNTQQGRRVSVGGNSATAFPHQPSLAAKRGERKGAHPTPDALPFQFPCTAL